MRLHTKTGLALAFCMATGLVPAQAGEIYRCDVNGVKTFVDSPNRCAGGQARRLGADNKVTQAPLAPRSATAAPSPQPMAAPAPAPVPVAAAPQAQAAQPAVPTECQKISVQDASKLRQCLRDERRKEVRRIATARLAGVSHAFAEYTSQPAQVDGELSIGKDGRPAAWCEDVLNDVIALKNVDVVDDEELAGPKWMAADGGSALRAAEILDPDFEELVFNGRKVVRGYVTVRWRSADLIVLRTSIACSEGANKKVICRQQPYTSIFVHDSLVPQACNVTFIARAYWPQWQQSVTRIQLKGSSVRKR